MLIVFGSIYLEFLYRADALLSEGETTFARGYSVEPGGRGVRQSFAAARWGVKTALVGRIGEDPHGGRIMTRLRRHGVMTSGIVEDDQPTGSIVRVETSDGRGQALVAPGANANTRAEQVPDEILLPTSCVMAHGDMPPGEALDLLERAKKGGAKILYCARNPDEVARICGVGADVILVDERDARRFAGNLNVGADVGSLAVVNVLRKTFGLTFVLFGGPTGAIAMTAEGRGWKVSGVPAKNAPLSPVAADCYCGTLAASLHDGDVLPEAMRKASVAASLVAGAAGDIFESYPYRDNVRDALAGFPSAEPVIL